MQKKVRIIIGVIIIVITLVTPSRAQSETVCWNRITKCVAGAEPGQLTECCPVLRDQVINETECFCGIKSFLQGDANAAGKRAVTAFLETCEIASSFDSVCPGAPPSNPIQPPPSDDPSPPAPPTTSSTPPPLYEEVPESNPNPNPPPRLDPEPSPDKGILGDVLGPVGAVIAVIIIIGLIWFCRRNTVWSCIPHQKANANNNNEANNPPPPAAFK